MRGYTGAYACLHVGGGGGPRLLSYMHHYALLIAMPYALLPPPQNNAMIEKLGGTPVTLTPIPRPSAGVLRPEDVELSTRLSERGASCVAGAGGRIEPGRGRWARDSLTGSMEREREKARQGSGSAAGGGRGGEAGGGG